MRKLYKFYWDCGRMGFLDGIFVAEEEEVNNLIGKTIYFGEVLGKHSDIFGTLSYKDLIAITENQKFIDNMLEAFDVRERFEEDGVATISGYNPFDYYDPDAFDDDEEDDE